MPYQYSLYRQLRDRLEIDLCKELGLIVGVRPRTARSREVPSTVGSHQRHNPRPRTASWGPKETLSSTRQELRTWA